MDEKFEGLRLYHYSFAEDGLPLILSYSAPAYDSWMLLPTFFEHPSGGYVILAEFGSTQSWGQKVFNFNHEGFRDLGFLDVAVNEIRTIEELDSTFVAKASIAPAVRIDFQGDTLSSITFNTDSVFVYDDLHGHLDTLYLGRDVAYHMREGKLELVVN